MSAGIFIRVPTVNDAERLDDVLVTVLQKTAQGFRGYVVEIVDISRNCGETQLELAISGFAWLFLRLIVTKIFLSLVLKKKIGLRKTMSSFDL